MGIVVISIVVLLRFILMHHCINEPKVYLEVTHIRVGGSGCARTHGDLETCSKLGSGQAFERCTLLKPAETAESIGLCSLCLKLL